MKTLVPHLILEQFAQRRYRGQFQAVTACFDISGFTPLTETLFRHRQDGAEILGETLGSIFGPLVSAVYRAGGLIPLFAGDAFTAIFPAAENGANDGLPAVVRAWQTAYAVQRYLMPAGQPRRFHTVYGTFGVSVKIGLASGKVEWGIVGEAGFRAYYFSGPAILTSNLAQLTALPGRIVSDERTKKPVSVQADDGQTAAAFSSSPPELSDRLAVYLPDFVPPDILTLPIQAEFRYVCPVFISVKLPLETAEMEQFILDVMRLTRHYGGYFSQVEFGDKGMVLVLYFGAPISYENNVLRAARCLSKLAEPRRTGGRPRPPWRAGLTYGLVWAGFRGGPERQEYGVIGDVVNSAARIAQEAAWGEIWLDEQAAEQLAGEFECRLIGSRLLKGRQTAKTLYYLVGPETKIDITYQGQMIGRQRELQTLREAVAPIFDGRFAGVGYVYGEAGMGKSRLLFELQQEIGQRVKWLYCPADEVLKQSLKPFRYLLQNCFNSYGGGQGTSLSPEGFSRIIEQLTGRLQALDDERAAVTAAELQRTQSCLAALLNIRLPGSLYERLEPRLRYNNTLAAITTYIQAQALLQPVVLQLEDFHWFDLDSRHLLEILSGKLDGFPAVLLVTSRFADDGSHPAFQTPAAVPQTIIELETLDRTGVRALAEQLSGGSIHSDLLGFLEEKSGGRPFFAEQLLLELVDQQAVKKMSGQFTLAPEKAGTLPTTLNTLLISRLDNLPLRIKQVVQTAAILGERFLAPVLMGMLAQEALPDMIQKAVERRIWVLQDEVRYIFQHALLRDAAYAMQPQSRRRELHRLAAKELEAYYAEQPAPFYGEIAYHYERAYLQGMGEVRKAAVHYLTLAAERAIDNYENDAAVEYGNRALTILPERAYEKRYQLLLMREHAHRLQAALDPWRADIEALSVLVGWGIEKDEIEGTAPLAKPEFKARVVSASVHFNYYTGNYQRAEVLAREGERLYEAAGDLFGVGKCLALQGAMLWELGQFDKANERMHKASAIFRRLGKEGNLAGSLNTLGIIAADQGKYMEAWEYYKEALPLAEHKHIDQVITTVSNLGEVNCWLGLYEEAQQYIERGLRLARQTGSRQRQSILLLNLSIVTLEGKDWQLGQLYLKRSLKICREIGNRREEGTVLHNLGYAAVLEGELETAEAFFQQALEIRQQLGLRQFAAEDRAALAWVAQKRGELDRAARYLHEVVDYLEENPAMMGAYKPMAVYWRLYEAARAVDGRLAEELLKTARTIIEERAANISDPEVRRAYLNVPENWDLMKEGSASNWKV